MSRGDPVDVDAFLARPLVARLARAIAGSLGLPSTRLGRLVPERVTARDMSFDPPSS